MKKILAKIKSFIRKIFGKIVPGVGVLAWDECTKSSNWWGANAAHRAMNALSPAFTENKFKEYIKHQKDRGCNYVNLFVTNKGDGEGAGYSIFGSKFNIKGDVDKKTCELMEKRIDYVMDQGMGCVLWMMADDSNAWAKLAQQNWDKYCKSLKNLGWFDKASMVVIGLEIEEYWNNATTVANLIKTLKQYYKGKVGTHHVSDHYALGGHADVLFVQMNPGRTDSQITNYVKKVKGTGKPVCMFELERGPDKHRSEVALKAGAFSVGNW